MPGPKPKPTHLKLLHGNPSKEQLALDEPQGVGVLWAPPEWMTDEEQRQQWHYAIEHAPLGLLTETDREILAVWVVAAVEHARATLEVRKLGQVVKTKDGFPVVNPYLGIVNRQALILLRCCGELGFSPASRTAIGRAGEAGGAGVGGARQLAGSRLAQYLDAKPDKLED